MNKQLIEQKTQALVESLKIEEQVSGMTTHEKLVNIAIRFARLSSAQAQKASNDCLRLSGMALKFGCN